jgi:hypothetical protein
MLIWKVFLIVMLFCLCLACSVIVFPMPLTAAEHRWLWLAGLLIATIGMGALFTLFLRRTSTLM